MTPRRATPLGLAFALATATAALGATSARAGESGLPPTSTPLTAIRVIARVPTVEAELLAAVNRIRAARHLPPFRASPALHAAAGQHSNQMARLGYFEHESPNGAPFWRRVQRYYRPSGYRRWSVGENIVYGSPSLSAAAALQEWLTSPPHRANLLSRSWRDTGIAAVYVAPAPGVFGNLPTTVITMDFGFRRR
jgi:uncharacterized protein YkwD